MPSYSNLCRTILESARLAQLTREQQEQLPTQQSPSINAPAGNTQTSSESSEVPSTERIQAAVTSTNRTLKRSRSESPDVSCEGGAGPSKRPTRSHHTTDDGALECSRLAQSTDYHSPSLKSSPEKQPAKYEAVVCLPHADFYWKEGNCVIMVEQTLFKLSWDIFVDNSSVLSELLGPAQRDVTAFLHMEDESADHFSTLCWVLTTEPDKAPEQDCTTADETIRLGILFHMAAKYKIPRYQEWSEEKLLHCTQDILEPWSLDLVEKVLTAASFDPDHAGAMQVLLCEVWKARLDETSTSSAKDALAYAERLGLRQLQGFIYYHELFKMNRMQGGDASTPCLPSPEIDLTPMQTAALFRGFWSIVWYWDILKAAPELSDEKADHCDACKRKWKIMWKRGRYMGFRADREGCAPLETLARLAMSAEEESPEHCGCNFAWVANGVYHNLLCTLGDHFLGSLKDSEPKPQNDDDEEEDSRNEDNSSEQ